MKTRLLTILAGVLFGLSAVYSQTNLPTDFPQYKDTGNREADHATYDKAKQVWVETNPEAYKKMGGQVYEPPTPALDPELDYVAYEPDKCEEVVPPPIVPANSVVWELTDAKVIDKNSVSESTQLQAEIREEFLSEKIYWKISKEGVIYMFVNDKYNAHYQFEKEDNKLLLFPHKETECNNGVKSYPIEKWDDAQLLINMPEEDEGSTIIYQLAFTAL